VRPAFHVSYLKTLISFIRFFNPLETPEPELSMDIRIEEKRRNVGRRGLKPGWFLVLCFGIALLGDLEPRLCFGAEKGSRNLPFSLSATSEPLDAVLEKISKASGYKITINEGWKNKAVTVRLENVTVEEGLKTLIEALGRPSHLLMFDESQKKIEIVMIPGTSGASDSSSRLEPPARTPRQIGPSSPERTRPPVRTIPRRTRQRVIPPPTAPEEVHEPDREETPIGHPEADVRAGDDSAEKPDSSEDVTPDSKQKAGAERKRKPADSSED
jgi:hypothetical protein